MTLYSAWGQRGRKECQFTDFPAINQHWSTRSTRSGQASFTEPALNRSCLLPLLVNKVLLEHSHAPSLRCFFFNGCFHTTIAESSSCDREHMASLQNQKIFTILPFAENFCLLLVYTNDHALSYFMPPLKLESFGSWKYFIPPDSFRTMQITQQGE